MKKLLFFFLIGTIIGCLSLASCDKILPPLPEEYELLDGPIEGLSHAENQRFLRGDKAFNSEVFTPAMGLGPLFVANSCGSCHAGDGKGHPFTTLTRFGQSDTTGNQFLHLGGPQLQHRALPGIEPETVPQGASFSRLIPPANTGLGFLEAVSDAELLSWADPDDLDGDGISGRPNRIPIPSYVAPRSNSSIQNGFYIGRFGKKAAVYNLLQQTANAYNQDMGIVSVFAPFDTYTHLEIEPEVNASTINDVVFYLQTLKAPIQRDLAETDVVAGGQLFTQIKCASCHRPQMVTGESSISALAGRTIYPYSDLLLHDMGPGLDDGYTEGKALSAEWRTPPLWGLGLSKNAQGGAYFLLHDGRARSIEEAILLHGGEGAESAEKFRMLNPAEQQQLITFLESL